jgi:PIN domain nuclease of toxin-antitoxin system
VCFSAVTPWELGLKRALGKLAMPDGLSSTLLSGGMVALPISAVHAELAPTLPPHHRDPFDRMLIAQAIAHGLAIVTPDTAISQYPVRTIW